MLKILLPILLCAIPAQDGGARPADGDLVRAHEMLAGSWEFVSMTDRGETLGSALLGDKFARRHPRDRRSSDDDCQPGDRRETNRDFPD